MSWSEQFKGLDSDSGLFIEGLVKGRNIDSACPEAMEQYVEAFEAAVALIRSGVIGKKGHKFNVNLSGHANTDHEPDPAWANDCLNISIYQVSE